MSPRLSGFAIRVLGPASIRRRGEHDAAPDSRLRALLAALTAYANQPVPEAQLLAVAWGGEQPANPEDSLATRMTRLRSALAPDAEITWSEQGYLLRVDPGRVDATRFERLVDAARHAQPRAAASLLLRALALWRGPAYQELRRDGLDHPEALRLAEVGWRAVEDLAGHELRLGRAGLAAERLLEALAANPLRERMCALAMHALHRAGRTAEALNQYQHLCDRLAADLDAEPAPELRAAYRLVAGRAPPPPSRAVSRRAPPTSFVGRDAELARLTELVDRDRLITLTGPGGSGKTRLAFELVPTVDVPGTVVGLASAGPTDVPGAVAAALGVHTHGRPEYVTSAIAECLAGSRSLLVLDGCEHVLMPLRALVKRLQADCPGVTILATSRVPLGLGGERTLPIAALPAEDAGQLFLERATDADPAFSLTPLETAMVQAVLRGTGRLPLTVELAAARAGHQGLAALADLPKDTVAWCYERLEPDEAELLTALAVFPGEFDASAATAVTDDDAGRLAATGLLTVDRRDGNGRYRLPDVVRQYAARELAHSPGEYKVRERHARWCLDLTDTVGAERIAGDVAVALRWAEAEQPALAAQLTGRLGLLCPHRSTVDFLTWQLRLARDERPGLPCDALTLGSGARAALLSGEPELALRLADQAAALATTDEQRGLVLHTRAFAHRERGDHARSAAACRELLSLTALPVARHADAHAVLALLAASARESGEAMRAASTALALAGDSGMAEHVAFARYADGEARSLRDPRAGAEMLRTARHEARVAGAPLVAAAAGTSLAAVFVRLGRFPEAARLVLESFGDWRRLRSRPRLVATSRLATTLLNAAGVETGELSPSAAEAAVAATFGIRSVPVR